MLSAAHTNSATERSIHMCMTTSLDLVSDGRRLRPVDITLTGECVLVSAAIGVWLCVLGYARPEKLRELRVCGKPPSPLAENVDQLFVRATIAHKMRPTERPRRPRDLPMNLLRAPHTIRASCASI